MGLGALHPFFMLKEFPFVGTGRNHSRLMLHQRLILGLRLYDPFLVIKNGHFILGEMELRLDFPLKKIVAFLGLGLRALNLALE